MYCKDTAATSTCANLGVSTGASVPLRQQVRMRKKYRMIRQLQSSEER